VQAASSSAPLENGYGTASSTGIAAAAAVSTASWVSTASASLVMKPPPIE